MLLRNMAFGFCRAERVVPVGILHVVWDMVSGGGMSGAKPRVPRVRSYLDKTVKSCEPGTILFTHELASALSVQYHHGESTRDIGMAMRERNDVRLVRTGVWEKI